MKKLLIGFGSKARIGKDYACAQLTGAFDVQRIAFADKLKQDLIKMAKQYNIDFEAALKDDETKEMLRPLLVMYGQTMRAFNENVWVDAALAHKELEHQVTIITDVRFPNEVKRLHQLGGLYIEIVTNKPPANDTEALFSPAMEKLADFKVQNDFDGKFITDLVNLIKGLLQLDASCSDQKTPVE